MSDVLIVDDERDIRMVTRLNLRRSGWEIDEAESGEEALERVTSTPYSAIVLDQRMTGISGLETARALRERGFPGVLVLFSAYLTPDIEVAAGELDLRTLDKAAVRELAGMLEELMTGAV